MHNTAAHEHHRRKRTVTVHSLARGLAVAGASAIVVRSAQLHPGPGQILLAARFIPEPVLLFLTLAGLLGAPILALLEMYSTYPRPKARPFVIDLLFVAAGYVAFALYLRFG